MRSEAPTTARHLQHVLCAQNPVNISSFFPRECGKSGKGIDCPRPRHTASGSNAHVASPKWKPSFNACLIRVAQKFGDYRVPTADTHARARSLRIVGVSAVGSQGGNSLTHGA